MFTTPRRGRYHGRLAFDPDTGFHTDPKGRKVVTLDEGLTWRYARSSDTSHNHRYQRNVLVVDSTANQLALLTVQHGPELAAQMVDPHHHEVQTNDDHYDHSAPSLTRPKSDPDADAATVTSHTEAWQ